MYAFKGGEYPAQWVSYSDLDEDDIVINIKETPPTPRSGPSLANFNDSHILVIGGVIPGNYSQKLATVDMYDVEMDSWWKPPTQVPALNQARSAHSSCCVGDLCYVGCGWGSPDRLHTFERINVADLIRG